MYTDITVILDRSGSMSDLRHDTIGGFNTFLADQQKLEDKATLSLIQFDDRYEVNYTNIDIREVKPLNLTTYQPRGSTALHSTVGRAIDETGKRLRELPEALRPTKVLFVIITDGHDNVRGEYSREKVSEMIRHQTEKYQWNFIYLGANQDAVKTAQDLHINLNNVASYAATSKGVDAVYTSVSNATRHMRSASCSQPSALFSTADQENLKNSFEAK